MRVDGSDVQWHLEPDTERLVVSPVGGLQRRPRCRSTSTFTGTLNDKLRGFYRSTFKDDDGTEHVIATTQMQATDCRRAFPCWDEPDFKAVFGVTLVIDPALMAVSNGPEVERDRAADGQGRRALRRHDGDEHVPRGVRRRPAGGHRRRSTSTASRCASSTCRARATSPSSGSTSAPSACAGSSTTTASPTRATRSTCSRCPTSPPGRWRTSAAITFRESLLLARSRRPPRSRRADAGRRRRRPRARPHVVRRPRHDALVERHLAERGVRHVHGADRLRRLPPRLGSLDVFGLERSAAFETDSLASTRSVEYPVLSPADCEGMFDVLTYQKGGALLRMLEQFLGAERVPATASATTCSKHAYGNTETNDLWDAIEDDHRRAGAADDGLVDLAAGLPAGQRIGRRRRAGAAPAAVRLRQHHPRRRRQPDHVAGAGARPQRRHRVGRCCSTATEVRAPLADSNAAVVVNAGGHGFYRVAYSDELRARLTGAVLASLDSLERYNLVDDAWQEVVAGRLAAADYLTFLEGFSGERELAVWQAIVLGVRGLGRLLDDDAYPRVPGPRPRPAGAGRRRARRPDRGRGRRAGQAARAAGRRVRHPRRRRADAGAGPIVVPSGRGVTGGGRSRAGRRGDHDRGHHRRRHDLRADARRLPLGGHAPGAAAPPQRPRRVRRRGARAAHVRAGDDAGCEDPERPVPAQPLHRQPAPRGGGVEVRPPALGPGQRAHSRATRSCA